MLDDDAMNDEIEGAARYAALCNRVDADPASCPDTGALARAAGSSPAELSAFLVRHAHMLPTAWLRRRRARAAQSLLLRTRRPIRDIAEAAGYRSEASMRTQFMAAARMTPEAYRRLARRAAAFELRLPARYRARDVLAYHGRDPASPSENVRDGRLLKAVTLPGGPAVLAIELLRGSAVCRLRGHRRERPGPAETATAHAMALRLLGLTADVPGFEKLAREDPTLAPLVAARPGLHLPLTATVFDALCWAILGQQINLAFAGSLRREILELAGEPVGGLIAHPTPERVASLDIAALRRRRFSRSKAEYLVDTAAAVAGGTLDPEASPDQSAPAVERALTRLRGIGTWTARYVMMRGAGFQDAAPVGDVALAAALARRTRASRRPAMAEVDVLMRPFSPYRSLATFHLWTSLREDE